MAGPANGARAKPSCSPPNTRRKAAATRKAVLRKARSISKDWTEEKWKTADGKPAARGKTTARYLPEKAWDKLSPAEKKATDEKKKKGSRTGKQFVANTEPAKKARKSAAKS